MKVRRRGYKLSVRLQMFIHYLLGDEEGNAVRAATRAGYKHAKGNVSALLRHPAVAAAIAERLDTTGMDKPEILERLARQARGTLADFFDFNLVIGQDGRPIIGPDGNPLMEATVNLDRARRAQSLGLIKRLTFHKDGSIAAIELYDAQAALTRLGYFHSLWIERVQMDERLNLDDMSTEELAELRERFMGRGRGRPRLNGTTFPGD